MNISTTIFNNLLQNEVSNTFFYQKKKKILRFLRKFFIKLFDDPEVELNIHNRILSLPLSHQLPIYLLQNPFYDSLLKRLGDFLRNTDGYIKCIDVGANIGDSIAAINQDIADKFIAIEAHPKFFYYLKKNWGHSSNITLIHSFCSSSLENTFYSIQEKDGTAVIKKDKSEIAITTTTIDFIIMNDNGFNDFNLLKIDTDGNDLEVLKGAKNAIRLNLPVILFECYMFEDNNYIENCLETMSFLREIGYNKCLLYDNFGYLICKINLDNLFIFKQLLLYHAMNRFDYFDILVMKDPEIEKFHLQEIEYFTKNAIQKNINIPPQMMYC